MKTGKVKSTRFKDLRSRKLNLQLPPSSYQYDSISNCATAALSILTQLTPKYVQSKCLYPGKKGWYNDDMVKFLQERNYKVVEVTRNSVTNVYWEDHPLTNDHCLLVVSWMNTEEASALVIHKGKAWHNLRNEHNMSHLYFLNKPTVSVFIIQHPKWM